jgi:hypothetical protein
VCHIRLYDSSVSPTMLTAQFILGLKEELRFPIEMQLMDSVAKATVFASLQEKLLEKNQKHVVKSYNYKQQGSVGKSNSKPSVTPSDMWKARQLKEHKMANGLCLKCGDKFVPQHKCAA